MQIRRLIVCSATAAAALAGPSSPALAWSAPPDPVAAASPSAVRRGDAEMGWRSRASVDTLDARRAPFTPVGVLGIDVSGHQRTVDWAGWAGRGRTFAYVKATEGTSYRNPRFSAQYGGAAAVGMYRGAYHFANPAGRSGRRQAAYFVRHGGAWVADGRTLPGVLDIEYNPYGHTCYGVSKKKMVAWIASFTAEYRRLTGRDAVLYTTTDWWTRCTGNSTRFRTTNPLWLARYGTTNPGKLPGGWPFATFWQYTASPLDQDWFSATPDRLAVLAGADPGELVRTRR